MKIRLAQITDLESMIRIYNQSVEAGFATADITPIKVEERQKWFREHRPDEYPLYVAEDGNEIAGWISVSPYRAGRMALRFTKEISYYVDQLHRRKGLGSRLVEHVIAESKNLKAKTLIAIVLDQNSASIGLLEKQGFSKWGHLPSVADFNGIECGHFYFGKRLDG